MPQSSEIAGFGNGHDQQLRGATNAATWWPDRATGALPAVDAITSRAGLRPITDAVKPSTLCRRIDSNDRT